LLLTSADFLPSFLFYPEDGGGRYNPLDRTLHDDRRENLKSNRNYNFVPEKERTAPGYDTWNAISDN
jgi:hypothetical protein